MTRKPSKTKARFHVGQVVMLKNYLYYLRVTHAYQEAEGVGRGLRWWYKLMMHDQLHTISLPQHELRPLTKREAR